MTNKAAAKILRELAETFRKVESTAWNLEYADDAPYKSFPGETEAFLKATDEPRRKAKAAMDKAVKHWELIREAIGRYFPKDSIGLLIEYLKTYGAAPHEIGVRKYSRLNAYLVQARQDDPEVPLFSDELERWAKRCEGDSVELVPDRSNGKKQKEPPRQLKPVTEFERKVATYYEESGKTQAEVADKLNKSMKSQIKAAGRWPLTQGKVCRIIQKVNRSRRASGLPEIKTRRKGKVASLDPNAIDTGKRTHPGTGLTDRKFDSA